MVLHSWVGQAIKFRFQDVQSGLDQQCLRKANGSTLVVHVLTFCMQNNRTRTVQIEEITDEI